MTKSLFGLCLLPACRPAVGAPDAWHRAVASSERLHAEGKLAEARNALLAVMHEAASSNVRLAYTHNNLGSIAQDQGRYTDAERHYRLALRQWEAAGEHLGSARTLNNLASLLFVIGKLEAAEEMLRRAEEFQIEAMGADHPETARVHQNHGAVYLQRRDYKQAELAYRRASEIWEKCGEACDLDIAATARGLAIVCS